MVLLSRKQHHQNCIVSRFFQAPIFSKNFNLYKFFLSVLYSPFCGGWRDLFRLQFSVKNVIYTNFSYLFCIHLFVEGFCLFLCLPAVILFVDKLAYWFREQSNFDKLISFTAATLKTYIFVFIRFFQFFCSESSCCNTRRFCAIIFCTTWFHTEQKTNCCYHENYAGLPECTLAIISSPSFESCLPTLTVFFLQIFFNCQHRVAMSSGVIWTP